LLGETATRLAGSSDLYEPSGRRPYHSINFITSHDGFTLNDLVTYSQKHNEANGEGNRDGDDNNYSANYGVEGPTKRESVERTRLRQMKNMLATLMLSQGVPMMLSGDECRRTQQGNNNAYCQDNPISWFDWRLIEQNAQLVRFAKALIAFRRSEPTVRRTTFLKGIAVRPGELPDVSWFGPDGHEMDWTKDQPSLSVLFGAAPMSERGRQTSHHVLLFIHAGIEARDFVFPSVARKIEWRRFIDTAAPSPNDVYPEQTGPAPPVDGAITLAPRSLVCYVSV
jgi:glycogen operon protein